MSPYQRSLGFPRLLCVYDDCAGRLGYSIAEMEAQFFVVVFRHQYSKTFIQNSIFESFTTISVV